MFSAGGGSGQGHGRNPSRSTGTIPKTKHHNDISVSLQHNHPLNQNMVTGPTFNHSGTFISQQKPSLCNVPKNQVRPSWHSVENSSPRIFHKNGTKNAADTRRSMVEEYNREYNDTYGGILSEAFVLTRLGRDVVSQANLEANDQQGAVAFPAFRRTRMQDLTSSSPSSCSSQTNNETCRNEICIEHSRQCEQKKSNNIPRMNCPMDLSPPRSLESPSLSGQSASISGTLCLNGQGDAVNKLPEYNIRNEIKKLEKEERKLNALQEKQSVLLQRRKQVLNSPFESHRSEDGGQGDVLQRERVFGGTPEDSDGGRMGSGLYSPQTNGHFEENGIGLRDGESSEDSAVEDSLDDYMEAHSRAQVQGQIVRDKLAEINCLRAQLKQVKGLINMAQRSPVAGSRAESCNAVNSECGSSSEQAVNIRRQRSSHNGNADERQTGGSERGTPNLRPDSTQSNASTKAEELEHEKARLRHLQGLIARVQEFHSCNLPIPEYLLAELKSETDEGVSPSPRENTNSVTVSVTERPSTQDGPDDEFVDVDHVDNDENATALRRPNQNQDGFYSEQNVRFIPRTNKAVNVQSDSDRKLDFGETPPFDAGAMQESVLQPPEGICTTDEIAFENRCPDRNDAPTRGTGSFPRKKWKTTRGLVRLDGADIGDICLSPLLESAIRGVGGTVSFVGLRKGASDGRPNVGDEAHGTVREVIRQALLVYLESPSAPISYEDTDPSSIWEIILWDYEPHDGNRNVGKKLSRREPTRNPKCNEHAQPPNCTQLQHNLPDATILGDWNSVPEPEINSISHPLDPSQYHSIGQENNSGSSSNVNLFSNPQEVENRLRALAQSYQGLLSGAHMGVLPGNRPNQMYTAVMSSLPPPVNIPPPSSVAANSSDREHYYQQLFAASQLQYQQVVVTAVNQCYHLLWLQNQEIANLRSAVHVLTTNAAQMSGIPQGQEPWGISPPSPAPVPPTLNNQVAPGNRTNNYWDNFRSYSRQNLLSAGQAKSNEVFSHNPVPLAERSHNALHQPTNSAPVTHLPSALGSTALPMISPHSGFPGHLTGAMLPALASASCAPGHPSSSQHPEGHDVDGGLAALPEATHICRKDKQNLSYQAHQNHQARNDSNETNRQAEVPSSVVCDVHPLLLPQENSPSDMEVPMPMPSIRSHLSVYHRLSNPLSDCLPEVANRCADPPRSRNQVNSIPCDFPTAPENMNEARSRDENCNPRPNGGNPSWIGRRNWNNTSSWTPNFHVDAHSAHSMPEFRFNNVSLQENQPGMSKRNSIQKRCAAANQNYQRNIHGVGLVQPNPSRNIATPSFQHNNDCEPHNKLSKNPPGFESSRNFLLSQRSEGQTSGGLAVPCISNHHETAELDGQSGRCNPARHLMAATPLSESDLPSCETNKKHLKENRLQMNRSPKCQSKPVTPGGQAGGQTFLGRAGSKSNQTAGASKQNQDSAVKPSSSTNCSEDIREAVLAEMASLMSGNENQQFLTQLLRSLQLISTENCPQVTHSPQVVQSTADSQQIEEASSTLHGEVVPEEEERIVKELQSLDARLRRRTRATQSGERQSNSSHVLFDRSGSLPECETRGAAPNDTTDKFKDLAVELAAYIRAHLQDSCTSSMIDEISSLVLMFVPFARNSHSSGRSNPSQLEGLLGNALHRFQGRRLEVVCDEMTSVILKVLTNEWSFVHLIDSLDLNPHEMGSEAHGSIQEAVPHGWSADSGAVASPPVSSTTANCDAFSQPSAMRQQDDLDFFEFELVAELNGDLAEADQSHSSSLANGDVAMNLSMGHRLDVGMEDAAELSEAVAVGGVEENASSYVTDSRPQSCEEESKKACEPSDKSTSNIREQSESGESGAAAALTQEWEESSEEYQMATQSIDNGLDDVPVRLSGEQPSNQAFPSTESSNE